MPSHRMPSHRRSTDHAPRRVRAPRGRILTALLLLLTALLLTGCAQHPADTSSNGDSNAGFPVTLTPPGSDPVTLKSRPEKIVSLSPAETETLYGINAGRQVVAVDKSSDYPPGVPTSDIDALQPDIEAIAGYHPDLVIASNDLGGLVAGLKKIGVPVLLLQAPRDLDETYAGWQTLGKATGHIEDAEELVRQVRTEIDKIVRTAPTPQAKLTYYHELDPLLHTVTSKTFIGSIYARFGLSNIADPADSASAAGYPQLSAEQVITANPDLIFLSDTLCCTQDASTIAKRPGWSVLSAVRDGTVVPLNDNVASRWGPRLVELVRSVGAAVAKASSEKG